MNSDDPKFTAHVLGEYEDLTAAERAEIEALVFGDPAAAAEAAETRALAARLRAELSGEAAAGLKEGQRAAVLKAATSAALVARVVTFPRRTTALAAMAASLVVGVTAALVYRDMRETPVVNLPVLTRSLPENPVAIAAANISSPEAIPPPLPSSLRVQHAQQVQLGNIAFAESGNDHGLKTPVETPSVPPLEAMVLNYISPNNSATIVDAGALNVVTRTFVTTTTTLNYAVTGRNVDQAAVNEVDIGTFRVGGPPVVVEESKITTGATATFNVYIGSTAAGSGLSANTAGEQPLDELARGNRTTDLVAASLGELVSVKETAAGKDFTETVSGAVGSNTASFEAAAENAFRNARENPVSTFGIDVGTASYAIVQRALDGHQRPPQDVVYIEELLNYFTYDYPSPQGDAPLSATMEVAECPWAPEHRLVRIGLKGRENPGTHTAVARDVKAKVEFNPAQVGAYRLIGYEKRASAKANFDQARQGTDEISAGQAVTALYELVPAGKELPPLAMLEKLKVRPERELLREKDAEHPSEPAARKAEVEAPDPAAAAPASAPVPTRKVAPPRATPQLLIIPAPEPEARAAIPQLLPPHEPKPLPQVEPAPRDGQAELLPPHSPSPDSALRREPEQVQKPVAPYLVEQEPRGKVAMGGAAAAGPAQTGNALLTLKLRYKAPAGGASKLLVFPLIDPGTTWEKSSPDFRFAAAVAGYGMLLRDSSDRGQATWQSVAEWAREGLGSDVNGSRTEFLRLVEKARAVSP